MVAGSVREREREEGRAAALSHERLKLSYGLSGSVPHAREASVPFSRSFFSSSTGYNFLLSRKRASARFQFPSWFAESHYPSFLPAPTSSPCIIYCARCRTVIKTKRRGEKRKEKERDCCTTMNSLLRRWRVVHRFLSLSLFFSSPFIGKVRLCELMCSGEGQICSYTRGSHKWRFYFIFVLSLFRNLYWCILVYIHLAYFLWRLHNLFVFLFVNFHDSSIAELTFYYSHI